MKELDSGPEIAEAAQRLLRRASAVGRLPTPVDDLIAAAELTEPEESMLSESVWRFAPKHLQEVVARLAGRVRGLVDRRALEVHLAPEVTQEARRNFIRLHEAGHHILAWQQELAYADDDGTLSPATHERFELEASQCAADLLFQCDRFTADAADLEVGLAGVIHAANRYGSSIRAGLRRYTETHRAEMVSVVLDMSPVSRDPLRYRRHELNISKAYESRFGTSHWPARLSVERYPFLTSVAGAASSPRQVVAGEWVVTDLAGIDVSLRVEAICTGYDVLLVAWVPIIQRTRRRARLSAQLRS